MYKILNSLGELDPYGPDPSSVRIRCLGELDPYGPDPSPVRIRCLGELDPYGPVVLVSSILMVLIPHL